MSALTYATELKIASGWNNTAGYTTFTSLMDSDNFPFILPKPFENMTMGIDKPRLSRRLYQINSQYVEWYIEGVTLKQLKKLDADYQQTNDGKVTVRTVDFDGGYENFNAYIAVPRAWVSMVGNLSGNVTVAPGSYDSNWIADIRIGFNIIAVAS